MLRPEQQACLPPLRAVLRSALTIIDELMSLEESFWSKGEARAEG